MEFPIVVDELWKFFKRCEAVNVLRLCYLFIHNTYFGMAGELEHILPWNWFEKVFLHCRL